jgi:hypothetical protein
MQDGTVIMPKPDTDRQLVDLLRDPVGTCAPDQDKRICDSLPAFWDSLCARAQEHRCLPALHAALAIGDPALSMRLRPAPDQQRRWLVQAMTLQAEALRLHHLLADAGIAHRFLKGIALAATVYPQIWHRPMRDIDILVAPADLAHAHAVVVAQGGVIAQYAHLGAGTEQTNTTAEAKHLPPLWSPKRAIPVELHGQAASSTLGLPDAARPALDAALWRGDAGFAVGGFNLPCPSREAMLLHLVIHGLHDHELNNGPILIADLVHLLRAGPMDLAYLQAQVAVMGLGRAMAMALSLLPPSLVVAAGLQPLCDTGPHLPVQMAVALLLQDKNGRNELRLAADLAQTGLWGRLRLLAGRVFASRETMLTRWQMEHGPIQPPRSLPWLWLWFLRARMRRMSGFATEQGLPATDLRSKLLSLRALRDGTRA